MVIPTRSTPYEGRYWYNGKDHIVLRDEFGGTYRLSRLSHEFEPFTGKVNITLHWVDEFWSLQDALAAIPADKS